MNKSQARCRSWSYEVSYWCVWNHEMRMAHSGGETPENHSCMHTITWREFVALSVSHLSWSWQKAIKQTMCHCNHPNASLTWGSNYIRTHIVPNNEKNQALAAMHSQTLQVKNALKYYSEFYLKTDTISSLFHLCEYSLYVYEEVITISVHTSAGRQNFRWSRIQLQRAWCNPHLSNPVILGCYRMYRIWGALVHHNQIVPLHWVLRRTTLSGWGGVVSSY